MFDLCNNSDMLILLLYSILFFTCCLMRETMIWQLIGYFGKNPNPNPNLNPYPKFRVLLFSGQFLLAFLDTRIFHYTNYPTRITRTPKASKLQVPACVKTTIEFVGAQRLSCHNFSFFIKNRELLKMKFFSYLFRKLTNKFGEKI